MKACEKKFFGDVKEYNFTSLNTLCDYLWNNNVREYPKILSTID